MLKKKFRTYFTPPPPPHSGQSWKTKICITKLRPGYFSIRQNFTIFFAHTRTQLLVLTKPMQTVFETELYLSCWNWMDHWDSLLTDLSLSLSLFYVPADERRHFFQFQNWTLSVMKKVKSAEFFTFPSGSKLYFFKWLKPVSDCCLADFDNC